MRKVFTAAVLSALTAAGCYQTDSGLGTATSIEAARADADTGTTARAAAAAAPAWREVTIPAGTTMALVLDTPVGSDSSRVEDPIRAHLATAVVVDGVTALAPGTMVTGAVTEAVRSGKVKGRARIAVRFDTVVLQGEEDGREAYAFDAASVGRTAPATKKSDAVKIAAPAAGGAIVGGLVGGKKGALIGGAAGGGAGTAVVLSTRGKEVRLGKGASMSLRLTQPLTVRIPA